MENNPFGDVFSAVKASAGEYVSALQKLCRMESVSAQNRGIEETAEAVRGILAGAGAETRILRAEGANPAVYGEIAGESKRTILFYNHYDVQPPEPIEKWRFKPFSAEIEKDVMYARGAADNKGDFIARVAAVKALGAAGKKLPVTVKFLVEGEEEIGSPGLAGIIKQFPFAAEADACVWEMGRKTFDGRPVIFLGVKGMLYVELAAKGAGTDSHSSLATTLPNPAWKLVWALNSLKDEEENIKIPGFYDGIEPLTEKELSLIGEIPEEDEKIKRDMHIDGFLLGLSGYERIKRDIESPTCTICGISSGYDGEGSKTVLPAGAMVKIDFRLVPGQDPEEILAKLRNHLDAGGFGDITLKSFTKAKAFKTPADSEFAGLVAGAAGPAYGKKPVVYPIMPGTGPMNIVCGKHNTPCVGTGIANSKSAIHAPNENIVIDDFIDGIKHIASIISVF